MPYDIVFLLNHLFAAIGDAIRDEGGWIDRYTGDGLIALFGKDTDSITGCRQALRAARAIDLSVEKVGRELEGEVRGMLRIGMGLHVGRMVLGRIGHPDSASLTAVGSVVNIASRLEALCKERRCQLVFSADVAETAELDCEAFAAEMVDVRGLSEPLRIYALVQARALPDLATAPLPIGAPTLARAAATAAPGARNPAP